MEYPSRIGDGTCHRGVYNSESCGWDGGDCVNFLEQYPNCTVEFPVLVGNGKCNGGAYNTEECGWDGGDCDNEKKNMTLFNPRGV